MPGAAGRSEVKHVADPLKLVGHWAQFVLLVRTSEPLAKDLWAQGCDRLHFRYCLVLLTGTLALR